MENSNIDILAHLATNYKEASEIADGYVKEMVQLTAQRIIGRLFEQDLFDRVIMQQSCDVQLDDYFDGKYMDIEFGGAVDNMLFYIWISAFQRTGRLNIAEKLSDIRDHGL